VVAACTLMFIKGIAVIAEATKIKSSKVAINLDFNFFYLLKVLRRPILLVKI
jgi:hypothetical protein